MRSSSNADIRLPFQNSLSMCHTVRTCVVLSFVLTASKMATKVKIRVDPTCKATKSDLLAICATNEVKIVKIFERPEEYVVLCSTLDDSEKLLSPHVIRAMSACNLTPVLPFALRAQRSLLVFHLDSLIFDHSTQEIKDEIQERNPWATVTRVGLGMYPGIYPFNPLGWVFSVKNPGFLLKVGFLTKLLLYSIIIVLITLLE